jgi:hypothetical protein
MSYLRNLWSCSNSLECNYVQYLFVPAQEPACESRFVIATLPQHYSNQSIEIFNYLYSLPSPPPARMHSTLQWQVAGRQLGSAEFKGVTLPSRGLVAKKIPTRTCHSERSEESILGKRIKRVLFYIFRTTDCSITTPLKGGRGVVNILCEFRKQPLLHYSNVTEICQITFFTIFEH